ncbi:MAG: hypothetical protein ACTHJT_16180, partial [Cytophaga sp.]|uniref:hypothetical protein n=1 Tax=Cytophaga sp. TaxID=29535 RepID=UPI003F803120
MAHSCGETGGDMYFLWDGKTINYFCFDYDVGDGGYSEGEVYTFPAYQNGIPGKMLLTSYASEMINIIPLDDCEAGYADAINHCISSEMVYNGAFLEEVPSKYLNIRKLAEKEFPYYKPVQYKFGDINGDKIEDVVFQLRMDVTSEVNEYGEYDYTSTNKTKMCIAFGNAGGGFENIHTNEIFIREGESSLTISLKGSEIFITNYIPSSRDEWDAYNYARKIYSFVYNTNDKSIYLKSASSVDVGGYTSKSFIAEKIPFKDVVQYEVESEPIEEDAESEEED